MKLYMNREKCVEAKSEHVVKAVPGDLDGIYAEHHVMLYAEDFSFVLFGSVDELKKLHEELGEYLGEHEDCDCPE